MQAVESAEIRRKIEAARTKLLAAVDGLDEEAWQWSPSQDRWSVRSTLAHVGSAQWSHLDVARRLLSGESTSFAGFDLDTWNNAQVSKRSEWSTERVLADLDAANAATLEMLDRLDSHDLAVTGTHPALGEVSVAQVLRIIAVHDGMHLRDVVRLLREMDAERGSQPA
jgi:uncharacterized damage-inducible protein DinB